MLLPPRLQALFLLNATILITHQIDAAFWHEWELFHIPGGNQINLLLNLPIIALVLFAQGQVTANTKNALGYYKLVAFLGLLTAGIHSAFFVAGSESFMQPASIALLIATTLASSTQLFLLRSIAHE